MKDFFCLFAGVRKYWWEPDLLDPLVSQRGRRRHCAGAEYASVTAGRMPGVTDQDLRRSEAWLGNHRRLAGVIRAVVASPPLQGHPRGRGRGGHLARPRRGAEGRMVQRPPRGVGCVYCYYCGRWWLWLWQWCVKVSLFFRDKNDNFACNFCWLKKKEKLPTLKKVTNFEKRTKSYQVLKM
jgi:hypothetical protein